MQTTLILMIVLDDTEFSVGRIVMYLSKYRLFCIKSDWIELACGADTRMIDFVGLDDIVLCRSMRDYIMEHDKVFFSDCIVW